MTPDEIKRYLALPERFREPKMRWDFIEGWTWWHNKHHYCDMPSEESAETIAIASMVVGLMKIPRMEIWHEQGSTITVWCGGDESIGTGEPLTALLAACEAVAKEAK